MNIAYLNNHYQLGGAETVMRQLHSGMVQAGHRSTLLVSEGKNYPRGQSVIPLYPRLLSRLDHSRLHQLVHRLAPRPRWTDQAVRRLANSSYDLIHIHNFHGIYASINSLSHLLRFKPVVWTFHRFWGITGGCDHPFGCDRFNYGCGECPQVGNFNVGLEDNTSVEWHLKMSHLMPLPLTVVAPSQHLADLVRSSPIGRNWETITISNGIDPSSFSHSRKRSSSFRIGLGLDANKTILLFTNRNFCDHIKGWPVIQDALSRVSPTGLQLILIGEGSSWALKGLPRTWDVVDCGYLSDRHKIAQIYESADIFLYASRGENFPCAILEAMSSGCCVISTPVDGVLEQVEHDESGLIAESNNGHALARCLTDALQDPKRVAKLGLAARERVISLFSEEGMVREHEALYAQVISRYTAHF